MLADRNREMLARVADRLSTSREEFVFVGGAVVGLLVTDPATASPRPTDDVDVIVEVAGYADYQMRLLPELKRLGLHEDIGATVTCRWLLDGVKVDVMPTDESILGFANRWYAGAIATAWTTSIDSHTIRVITAPYFLATKLDAFRSRGRDDYYGSHDLEDIVIVVDGRPEVVDEVAGADAEVRAHVSNEVRKLLDAQEFLNALPGYLTEANRSAILSRRLEAMAAVNG